MASAPQPTTVGVTWMHGDLARDVLFLSNAGFASQVAPGVRREAMGNLRGYERRLESLETRSKALRLRDG